MRLTAAVLVLAALLVAASILLLPAPALAGTRSSEPSLLNAQPKKKVVGAAEKSALLGLRSSQQMTAASPRTSLFVKASDGHSVQELAPVLTHYGFRIKRTLPQLGVAVLEGPPSRQAELLALLGEDRRLVWSHGDSVHTMDRVPNDELYEDQWYLPQVGLPEAWEVTTGDSDIVLAVLDTGLCREIPDFQDRIVHPYSVVYDSEEWPSWEDVLGHGTAVASMALARGDNQIGLAGAAWEVSIMPVHVSDTATFSLEQELLGLIWAVEKGADIINISAGSPSPSAAEEAAVRWALRQGVTIVASAGNGGPRGQVSYPAGYQGVIAVGATDSDNEVADFSSIGAAVDLVAPGEKVAVWTADASQYGFALMDGTSFSAPLISGIVALMLSADPTLTAPEIEALLTGTATDLGRPAWDSRYGMGLVNAAAVVAKAAAGERMERAAFSDVPEGHPYAQAISALSRADVVQGYGEGTFKPDQRVSRQEFAKMILLALDQLPTEDLVEPFDDVQDIPGIFPDDYIALAYELGITMGISSDPPLFGPHDAVRRAQVTTMAVRGVDSIRPGALETPPAGYQPPFGLFSAPHDGPAAKAAYNGLYERLVAVGPWYDPWRYASRGEVAGMLAPLVGME